jgi:hypothetical protein
LHLYAIDDAKVYKGFSKVSLKAIQATLHKTIPWTKKASKGRQEWKDLCIIARLSTKMFKTFVKMQFASRIFLFQKTFEYQITISICYGQQQVLHLFSRMLIRQTWVLTQAIVNTLFHVVKQCVLNQTQGYWLLPNAFTSSFTLCLVMNVDVVNIEALNH